MLGLLLSFAYAEAGSLAGPPLPPPYEVQDLRACGQDQIVLASFVNTDQQAGTLLLRRNSAGKTLWKTYLGWKFGFEEKFDCTKTVELRHIEAGRPYWYVFNPKNGKFLERAIITIPN